MQRIDNKVGKAFLLMKTYCFHLKMNTFLIVLVLFLLTFITGCCGKGSDGNDGRDGSIFATFYFPNNEIVRIRSSEILYRFSRATYTGKDGIESKYYFVDDHDGSFSWTTSDNQTYTANINFKPNLGEPGEEGDEGCYQPINANPTYLDGQDGKGGEDKYMVIKLEGETATFVDNTCPEKQCETTSTNTNEF
ncbi:hypothetical protein WDW89_12890 [Deltaproteobacteria bacterium TL4]